MMVFKVILCSIFHIMMSTCYNMSVIERSATLANSAFKLQFMTSVVWWRNDPDDVIEFLKKFQGSVVLTSVQNGDNEIVRQFHKRIGYRQTVFIAPVVDEVEYFVTVLNRDLVIPIRLILVLTKPASDTELSHLMQTAWENDLSDILVVTSKATEVILRTYFPYSKGKCGDFTPVPVKYHDSKQLFPKKFNNFHGCEIRATLIPMSPYSRLNVENGTVTSISGIDGVIFTILLGIVNARLNIVSAKDHGGIGTLVNGTLTGSFGDLVRKEADIFSPAAIINFLRYPMIQIAHMFEIADIHWYGPKRREISEWLRIVKPFMSDITLLLVTSFLVFAVTVIIVRRCGLHKSFSRDSVFFQMFVMFLGQEVKFETRSWLTNSLFVIWIWFCMVVRIAYQGDLVDGMQKTILESPLGTFDEAVKRVDGYGGAEVLRDFIKGTQYYQDYKVITFKNVPCHLKAVGDGKRFLLVTEKLIAMDSSRQLQVLTDGPVTIAPVVFFMRPGWPAAKEIDGVLLRIIETGIVRKVYNEYYWEWEKDMDDNDDRDAQPLVLETLIGCFYGLGVFYAICILVLFTEISYYKLTQGPKTVYFFNRKQNKLIKKLLH